MSVTLDTTPARNDRLLIRDSDDRDIAAIQAIYAHHVATGTGTFEEVPPNIAQMTERRDAIVDRALPFLVADFGGDVVGFAYAAPFRPRSAYRFTVEDSIYVHPDAVVRGYGASLLRQLIENCQGLGYRQMVAVIGDSNNLASIRLHERLGFRETGRLLAVGYKFGRWLDVITMQRPLDIP
ncbi:MAG: N-acetyltransferase [Rhodospirillales bacterium]|nr:N-acetyltransferase [Rhodospirillales bacterium]